MTKVFVQLDGDTLVLLKELVDELTRIRKELEHIADCNTFIGIGGEKNDN